MLIYDLVPVYTVIQPTELVGFLHGRRSLQAPQLDLN